MVRALKTAPTRTLVRPTLRRGQPRRTTPASSPGTEDPGSVTICGRSLHSDGAYTSSNNLNRSSDRGAHLPWALTQPCLACADDGLRPVGYLQLEEDV